MTHRLPDFTPAACPFRVGDTVRVRPASEWLPGGDPGARPVEVVYREVGWRDRKLAWSAEHDALAGREFELVPDPTPGGIQIHRGLPCVRVVRGDVATTYALHPAWIGPRPVPVCACPLADLMLRGCRCGALRAGP